MIQKQLYQQINLIRRSVSSIPIAKAIAQLREITLMQMDFLSAARNLDSGMQDVSSQFAEIISLLREIKSLLRSRI